MTPPERTNGKFAQINFAADSSVGLRVQPFASCCTAPNCNSCEHASLDDTTRAQCYAAGCCCYGVTCTTAECCSGSNKAAKKASYSCPQDSTPLEMPGDSLVPFSVFDLDNGPNGEYTERIRVAEFAYFKAPLRASDPFVQPSSTLLVDSAAGTFSSTANGVPQDNPVTPRR